MSVFAGFCLLNSLSPCYCAASHPVRQMAPDRESPEPHLCCSSSWKVSLLLHYGHCISHNNLWTCLILSCLVDFLHGHLSHRFHSNRSPSLTLRYWENMNRENRRMEGAVVTHLALCIRRFIQWALMLGAVIPLRSDELCSLLTLLWDSHPRQSVTDWQLSWCDDGDPLMQAGKRPVWQSRAHNNCVPALVKFDWPC